MLTAGKNWSGLQTIYGKPLVGLLIVWLAGRFLGVVDGEYLLYQAIVDTGFLLLATIAIAYPILQSKSWKNLPVIGKILLLTIAHIIYYLGLFGVINDGRSYGLYLGFYLIVSLLLMMIRRLLPFFIERGLKLNPLKNSKNIDILSLILFSIFIIDEVFFGTIIANILAGILCTIHAIRAYWWFNEKIWQQPLLWSIYCAYCMIIFGFAIKFVSAFIPVMPNIDIHAFAFGIALMTISMMARVSLGHTGRDITHPPKPMNTAFILIFASFISRVIMPILLPNHYENWILFAQILWIVAFTIFVWIYTPILFKPRIDGKFG